MIIDHHHVHHHDDQQTTCSHREPLSRLEHRPSSQFPSFDRSPDPAFASRNISQVFDFQTSNIFLTRFFWGATRGCVVIYLILLTAFKLLLYRLSPTTFGGWASLTRPSTQTVWILHLTTTGKSCTSKKKGKVILFGGVASFCPKQPHPHRQIESTPTYWKP